MQVGGLLTAPEWAMAGAVYLTGDGDSYHAACAAAMAFETIAGRGSCEPLSALRFFGYCAPWLRPEAAGRPLVIAVSASGATQRVAQAIEAAKQHGALTIAITGAAGGAVTQAADRALVIELDRPERSPGIRTYQASLLGLLLTAIHLGHARGDYSQQQARALRDELSALAGAVAATATIKDQCRDVAGMAACSPVLVMTGSGPSYGTALFAAAKMTETAGVFAAGQDLEEWCHVERFAYPDAMPVFVIAPPGRSRQDAATVAATAQRQGRQVIAVTDEDDTNRHRSRIRRAACPRPGTRRVLAAALPRLRRLRRVLHGYPARTAAVSSVTSRALTVTSAYGLLLRSGLMADAAPA